MEGRDVKIGHYRNLASHNQARKYFFKEFYLKGWCILLSSCTCPLWRLELFPLFQLKLFINRVLCDIYLEGIQLLSGPVWTNSSVPYSSTVFEVLLQNKKILINHRRVACNVCWRLLSIIWQSIVPPGYQDVQLPIATLQCKVPPIWVIWVSVRTCCCIAA